MSPSLKRAVSWLTDLLSTEEARPTQAPEATPAEVSGVATTEGEEGGAVSTSSPGESADEVPHARGPPVLGVEDLGLQDGKGVEMTLAEQESQGGGSTDAPAPEPSSTEGPEGNETKSADKDGDIILEDSKPKEDIEAGEEKSESPQKTEKE